MKTVAPRVSRDEAWQKLTRQSWTERLARPVGLTARWMAGLARPAVRARSVADSKLPLLELTWLPNYRATISARSAARTATFDVLVDAHSGFVVMTDLADSEWTELAADSPTELAISAAGATQLARSAVNRAVISRPGWGRRFEIEQTRECELIGYPVWAYYFATYRGMLDAKLLDALTGAPGGARLKRSLLALLAGDKLPPRGDE